MNLQIQIITLVFSFLYGIFFSILATVQYKFINHDKKWIRLSITFLFILVNVLLYFIGLRKLSEARLHPYLLIAFFIGVLVESLVAKWIAKKRKK